MDDGRLPEVDPHCGHDELHPSRRSLLVVARRCLLRAPIISGLGRLKRHERYRIRFHAGSAASQGDHRTRLWHPEPDCSRSPSDRGIDHGQQRAGGWLGPLLMFWLYVRGPLRPFHYRNGDLLPPASFIFVIVACISLWWLLPRADNEYALVQCLSNPGSYYRHPAGGHNIRKNSVMRRATAIVFSDAERTSLLQWARGRVTPDRPVLRAKIVLAAATGKENKRIAEEICCTRRTAAAC